MAASEEQPRKRTPFSAKLPQASLDEVLPVVEALAALGTASTPHVIAQQMSTSYRTDSRFRTRLGAAGYYGFMVRQGDRRALTPRGEAATGDDKNAAGQARREAVMSTAFGPIIYSLRGNRVNEHTLALRVQSDYDVPEASAKTVAKALVSAATQAGLISNERFDAVAIEGAAQVMPSPDDTPAPPKEKKPTEQKPSPLKQVPEGDKRKNGKEKEKAEPPFVPGVQVVVKIDASTLTPREIAELVRSLQAPTESQDS